MKSERKFFTQPKDYLDFLKIGLIIFVYLLIALILPKWVDSLGSFYVPVAIREMGETSYTHGFYFSYKNVIRILSLGLVWAIMTYVLLHRKILELSKDKKTKNWLDISVVFLLMINMSGHVIHWLFDFSNSLYKDQLGYESTELYSMLYFSDEFLAHGLIHISYFVIFIIMILIEQYKESNKEATRKMHPDEYLLLIFISGGIWILNGPAALKGETGFLLYILSIVVLIVLIPIIMRKNLSLTRHPMLFSFIIGSLLVIIQTTIHIIVRGLDNVYPYIHGPPIPDIF
ncbi:MAG: hypothetical protein GF364_22160 [Candidatus Lokiarchaeota archaeon]|nr:hypothetical protein [Candidatus Lokiarchaeota archaeon]